MYLQINNGNIGRFIAYLSNLHNVIVYCFSNGKLLGSSNLGIPELEPSVFMETENLPLRLSLPPGQKTGLITSQIASDIYFAALAAPDGKIYVIGPVSCVKLNSKETREYLKACHTTHMSTCHIPHLPTARSFQLLSFLNFLLTGDDLTCPGNVPPEETKLSGTENEKLKDYQYGKFDTIPHYPYILAKKIELAIASGDFQTAYSLIQSNTYSIGILAFDSRKDKEYATVLSVTQYRIIAVENGVNFYDANDLNELFLQKISLCKTAEEYESVNIEALRTFCSAIRKIKSSESSQSAVIEKCKSYVSRHLTKDLSLNTIAGQLGVSAVYLSGLFSKTEGMTLKQYIISERLTAARHMLRFSDYTVSEISNYLNFSSQSYFGSVFRKSAGCSPSEYRKQYHIKS